MTVNGSLGYFQRNGSLPSLNSTLNNSWNASQLISHSLPQQTLLATVLGFALFKLYKIGQKKRLFEHPSKRHPDPLISELARPLREKSRARHRRRQRQQDLLLQHPSYSQQLFGDPLPSTTNASGSTLDDPADKNQDGQEDNEDTILGIDYILDVMENELYDPYTHQRSKEDLDYSLDIFFWLRSQNTPEKFLEYMNTHERNLLSSGMKDGHVPDKYLFCTGTPIGNFFFTVCTHDKFACALEKMPNNAQYLQSRFARFYSGAHRIIDYYYNQMDGSMHRLDPSVKRSRVSMMEQFMRAMNAPEDEIEKACRELRKQEELVTLGFALEVSRGDIVTQKTMRQRYREFMYSLHPDKSGLSDDESTIALMSVKEAHDFLKTVLPTDE